MERISSSQSEWNEWKWLRTGYERAANGASSESGAERTAGFSGQRRRTQFRFHDRPLHSGGPGVGEQVSLPSFQRRFAEHQRRHRGSRLHGRILGPQGTNEPYRR